jgi:hypothetical protein
LDVGGTTRILQEKPDANDLPVGLDGVGVIQILYQRYKLRGRQIKCVVKPDLNLLIPHQKATIMLLEDLQNASFAQIRILCDEENTVAH